METLRNDEYGGRRGSDRKHDARSGGMLNQVAVRDLMNLNGRKIRASRVVGDADEASGGRHCRNAEDAVQRRQSIATTPLRRLRTGLSYSMSVSGEGAVVNSQDRFPARLNLAMMEGPRHPSCGFAKRKKLVEPQELIGAWQLSDRP